MASQEGRLPVAQALLQAGADVDHAKDGGWTPLIMASQKGHAAIVRLLQLK
jgi:serine/threonine-protein phosphatase 6 regulatory ankyrin repeat subunit B